MRDRGWDYGRSLSFGCFKRGCMGVGTIWMGPMEAWDWGAGYIEAGVIWKKGEGFQEPG